MYQTNIEDYENYLNEDRNYYLNEYVLHDEFNTVLDIVEIDTIKHIIHVAVTKSGKTFITDFDLFLDKDNKLFFYYGVDYRKLYLDDFEEYL